MSDPGRKNLTHEQAGAIADDIQKHAIPVVFDSNVNRQIRGAFAGYRMGIDGGDAEHVAALVSQCEAFVGIDSGPAHAACSTNTPALVVWTGHHPLQYMDPAPNVLHLVPENHREMEPVRGHPGCADWFEGNYRWRAYRPFSGVVDGVRAWLGEVLR